MRLSLLRCGQCLPVFLLSLAVRAQDPLTKPIPDSLKQGAVMVCRFYQQEITIESMHKARVHRKYLYTILSAEGEHFAQVVTFFDKFHDLSNATATLYDADGKVLKKVKKGDLEEANIGGLGMLMVDTKVKYYSFASRNFPYTVGYEEELTIDNLFMLPVQWLPQPSANVAVMNSSLIVHAPADFPLRYKEYALPASVAVTENKSVKSYTWELNNHPALAPEPYAPSWSHREPCVKLSAGRFELEGYKGSCDSWGDFGKFVALLFQGRGQLPPEARQKVHALVDGLTDPRARIDTLYSFLQQNTHYVGIELGIGGWQPYDATYVYQRKYGDCKALSNYMVALLKEAGIRASPVLINGGPEPPRIDTGFACPQFNHCIAVAFTGADSIWLECTSTTMAPGYLSSFTSDRQGLLLDESGGHLVHTPVYGTRENRLIRHLKGAIADNGTLDGSLKVDFTGLEQDAPQSMANRLTKKDFIDAVRQSLGLPGCTISDWQVQSTRASIPSLEESMQLSAEHFATVNGNRIIIPPGHFMRHISRLSSPGADRRDVIELRTSVDESDSIVLQLPHGYTPEHLPSGNLSYPFGSFRIRSSFENDVLTIACRYREQKGIYPPDSFAPMARLFDFVWREDNSTVVFVKQQ